MMKRCAKIKCFKAAAYVLLLCLLTLLSGCQLAVDPKDISRDQFIGISMMLDTDFAFNTSPDGSYFDRSQPHEPDGKLLHLDISATETGEAVMEVYSDDCFAELNRHFHTIITEAENSETVQLEATVYICPKEFSGTPYLMLEQLYRREDGSIYALDCGNNYGGSLDGLTVTLKESSTYSSTIGSSTDTTVEVKLHLKAREKVSSVRLLAMRGMDIVEIIPIDEQSELYLPECEWVLIEETLSDHTVQRTALNAPLNETTFPLYTDCTNGVFIPHTLTLYAMP